MTDMVTIASRWHSDLTLTVDSESVVINGCRPWGRDGKPVPHAEYVTTKVDADFWRRWRKPFEEKEKREFVHIANGTIFELAGPEKTKEGEDE